MTRQRHDRGPGNGPACPLDPAHGATYVLPTGRLFCAHLAHDGRPASHPAGAAPATRRLFDPEEVPAHVSPR